MTLFRNPELIEIRLAEHSLFAVQAHEMGRLGNIDRKNLALLGVSGVLGEDFLRNFKSLRIDYRNKVVEFAQ